MDSDKKIPDQQAELTRLQKQVTNLEQQLALYQGQSADEPTTAHQLLQSLSLVEAAFEATADGILVVDSAGKIARYNQRFLELWRIPPDIIATGDDNTVLGYAINQLHDPQAFLQGVQALYARPEAESFDVLEFADERVFERYSRPQRIGNTVVGRVWSFRDVTARVQSEQQRLELQEQTVQIQATALVELSTPLIPITERAVVMPLIGNIDPQRAERMMETLLDGVAEHRALLVILDVTGVTEVDTQVVHLIVQAAQAARLLGAQVILTGIQPTTAQLIVNLGITLDEVKTYSTLQVGIAEALRLLDGVTT